MRILLLNDFAEKSGGAESYLYNLKRLLEKHGHKVELSYSADIPKVSVFGSIFSPINFIKTYKDIKRLNPDIVHLHKYNLSLSPAPLIAAKFLKKKTIVTFHDFGLLCPNGWCVDKDGKPCKNPSSIRWVFRKSLSNKHFLNKLYDYIKNKLQLSLIKTSTDIYIAPSKAMAAYLKEIFKNKNIIHLPYFVESYPKIKHQGNKVVYVGRLNKEKGVDWLIRSFGKVVKDINSAKLLIIGNGPEKESLEQLTKKLNLAKNIKFIGAVDHSKIKEVYEQARVIIIPSIWMENNPLVLYETLSSGIPAIGTNTGGIPDLIKDNYNGYIIERFDEKLLSKQIIRLLKDKKLADTMGKNGKKLINEQFNPKKHLKKLIYHYENAK